MTLSYGMVLTLNYNVTLNNFNITGSGAINTSKVVTATVTGVMTLPTNVHFITWVPSSGSLTVWLPYGATIVVNEEINLFGNTYFVTNGTVYINPTSTDWYIDGNAWWINLGFVSFVNYNTYLYVGSFFANSPTTIGTVVNSGTMQFSNSGALYYESTTTGGIFYNCNPGVLKVVYGTGTSPGFIYLPQVYLDGTLAAVFTTASAVTSISFTTLFYWAYSFYTTGNMMWTGNMQLAVTTPTGTAAPSVSLCYETSFGSASLNPNIGGLFSTCLTSITGGNLGPIGGVCTMLNGTAASWANAVGSCPVGQQQNAYCGVAASVNIFHGSAGSIQMLLSLLVACITAMLLQ